MQIFKSFVYKGLYGRKFFKANVQGPKAVAFGVGRIPQTKHQGFYASVAAAMLLYMIVEPAVRESLRKLACKKDIKKARLEARKFLREAIANAYMTGYLGTFSEEDRTLAMESMRQLAESLSRKK